MGLSGSYRCYFYTFVPSGLCSLFCNAYTTNFVALLNERNNMFWYESDVRGVEEKKKLVENPKTLFYGSSSIRLWDNLDNDFAEYKPLNMGFGGSTLAACIVYFERLMVGLNPDIFVLYAGERGGT